MQAKMFEDLFPGETPTHPPGYLCKNTHSDCPSIEQMKKICRLWIVMHHYITIITTQQKCINYHFPQKY